MEHIKQEVKKFIEEREWTTQEVSNVAKSIVIEAAELMEKFQWQNYTIEEINSNPDFKNEIVEELADVLIYSVQMALILDCNIDEIVDRKLAKQRLKYPVEMLKGASKLKKYLEIKRKFRNR